MGTLLREKLNNNEVTLGLSMMYPAPGIIECMGVGWDWIWIDSQHGQIDYQTMLHSIRTAEICGLPAIPRVPGHEVGFVARVLDMEPAGIMIPMIDTPEQARQVVEMVCFPPLGGRSYGGRRVIDRGGREYCYTANDDTLLVVQIETPTAVENAEAIAATEGVDALFFGPDDIKLRMGIPINAQINESDDLARAMEKTIKAAKNAGKVGGCPAKDAVVLRLVASLGYQLIVGGGDAAFLRTASSATLEKLRNFEKIG
jgi:4-hydroxy-2-oxoheptanedioate aldolase